MHRVFEAQLLIITIIASLFLLLSCGREDEYIRLPDDLDTRSVKQTYAFAEDFVAEYLGSTYKLRRMNANFSDHGESWTVIYEYTKREGRKEVPTEEETV